MKVVHVNNLFKGMILEQDVLGKHDRVLLTSGTVLTSNLIDQLKKSEIKFICVIEKKDTEKPLIADQKLAKEYEKCLEKFTEVYQEVGLGEVLKTEIIEKSVEGLIHETIKNNNVLGRLRQIEVMNDYTYRHSMNVCILSTMIGKWLGYNERELKRLSISAMLHDIGKSRIPETILNKRGRLTAEEYDIMKRHVVIGYRIMEEAKDITMDIYFGVLQHHERIDGSGYCMGVSGNKIHEFAKIIAVADVFDAMTSNRIYKSKESPFKVAELIADNRFGILDPCISNCFLYNISTFYVGNIVKLNTGEIGEIVMINNQIPTKPLVKVEDKFIDIMKSKEYEIIDVIAEK